MAHRPVAELRVQHHGGQQLARVEVRTPGGDRGSADLVKWVERSPLPPNGMLMGGLALAGVGLALGVALPLTLATATLFAGMVTFGGGVAFLGGAKRRAIRAAAQRKALPMAPSTSPVVLAERARRVVTWLRPAVEATFEELREALRWTDDALLETLVHMKDNGALEEDLNLDSGQWVYRVPSTTETGTAASVMLEDRRAPRH